MLFQKQICFEMQFVSKNQTLNKIFSLPLARRAHTEVSVLCELRIKCKLFEVQVPLFPPPAYHGVCKLPERSPGPASPLQHLQVGLGSKSWLTYVSEYETNLHQRSASSAGFHSVTLPAMPGTEFLAAQAHPGL